MTKALIVGVDGQDGSYLAELLLAHDYAVTGWVPSGRPPLLHNIAHLLDKITLVEGDLREQAGLDALIEEQRPDEVYNLAAPSFPAASWEQAELSAEVAGLGVLRLLESIRKVHPAARFYQASSSELFGLPVEAPQRETTPFHPRNPYGIAKLFAHWTTVRFREQYGLFAAAGILYNHESPRRGLEFVTRKVTHTAAQIKQGQAGELLLGNLDARRDWGFAGDYVEAIFRMLHQDAPDDFIIGSGETHSVRELCELAFSCLDLDYRQYVKVDSRFYRPVEPVQLVADPSKARRKLKWQPKVSFAEMIRGMTLADLSRVGKG